MVVNWLVDAFLVFLPAYVANMVPVPLAKFNILGLRRPVDGGMNFTDGRRLFGDGKTWQGIFGATIAGALTGAALEPFGLGSLALGAALGFGAIFGDAAGSFVKRRLNIPRGGNAGLLDSTVFIVFALLFSLPLYQWQPLQMLALLVVTPLLHRGANVAAYLLKIKDVPW